MLLDYKGKYYKQMTIKSRDMEIPILVFGPILWPNHFIVLNFAIIALEKKQHQHWHFIDNGLYHYLEVNAIHLW